MTTSGLQTHDFLTRLKKAEDSLPALLLELAAVMRRMVEELERPQLEDIQAVLGELERFEAVCLEAMGADAMAASGYAVSLHNIS